MSLYKRNEVFWVQITDPDGRRIQRSTGTTDRKEAQELHDKLKAETWRITHLGEQRQRTWKEAVVRWLEEQSHKKSLADDQSILRWLDPHLNGLRLCEITRDVIDEITRQRLGTGVAHGTVNRTLALLRAILKRAATEWEWLPSAPHVRMLREPKGRVRWLSQEEIDRLVAELPEHLSVMVQFTLSTGLRESNVTGLVWSQVDLSRRCCWVAAEKAKGGRGIPVPLNEVALKLVTEQRGKHPTHVFTYAGRPVSRCNNHAWRKALKRAGIEDFRFHDLRHTWASWHVMSGTPLHVLKEMGSWATMDMVARYGHMSAEHLLRFSSNVTNLLQTKHGG